MLLIHCTMIFSKLGTHYAWIIRSEGYGECVPDVSQGDVSQGDVPQGDVPQMYPKGYGMGDVPPLCFLVYLVLVVN